MNGTCKPGCPMTYNVPDDMATDYTYNCIKERCAWWCEDAQKCVVAVLAEAQRKAAKAVKAVNK